MRTVIGKNRERYRQELQWYGWSGVTNNRQFRLYLRIGCSKFKDQPIEIKRQLGNHEH